jgi:hypothetical protein
MVIFHFGKHLVYIGIGSRLLMRQMRTQYFSREVVLSGNNIGAAGYVLCFYLYGAGIIIKREILFPHFGCWYASRKGRAAYATAACCFLEATNRGKIRHVV